MTKDELIAFAATSEALCMEADRRGVTAVLVVGSGTHTVVCSVAEEQEALRALLIAVDQLSKRVAQAAKPTLEVVP